MKKSTMTFEQLVASIRQVHDHLAAQAGKAVNISLSLRNWMIGLYIAEFELHGADRATYGDKLLSELSDTLTGLQISNCNQRQLYRYVHFYRTYPEIWGTLSPQMRKLLPIQKTQRKISGTVSPKSSLPAGQTPTEAFVQPCGAAH